MENLLILVLIGLAVIAGGGMLWFVLDQRYAGQLAEARRQAKKDAEAALEELSRARKAELAAEAEALKRARGEAEAEAARLTQAREALMAEQAALEADQAAFAAQQTAFAAERAAELERLSGLSADEAKALLLAQHAQGLDRELNARLRAHEQAIKEGQAALAGEILTRAVQRTAVSHAREQMAVCVELPDASWRGKVIGKEGRTVQALQAATGADFSLDEERPAIWISSFDPWRRELARRTLEALMTGGRLQPARIEDEARAQQAALEAELPRLGEDAAVRAGVHGLAPEILVTLGRLHYRRSLGQDVLGHAVEVALLAAELARQLQADLEVARRGGLLHDLGKALSGGEAGESHTALGVELARRCGEAPGVLHAIAAHHGEDAPHSLEALIVQIADTLSAARPGARSEQLARHVQRLGELERIACGFDGVLRAWVLRAGKEVRVLVDPDEVSEERIRPLAGEIAAAIGAQLQAGQVKVSVIREIQATGYAR